MEYCELLGEGHCGEIFPQDMDLSRLSTAASVNRKTWGRLRQSFEFFLYLRTFEKISIETTSCMVYQSTNSGEKMKNRSIEMSSDDHNMKIRALIA